MAITEKQITLCGHGSGTPSLKRMDQYLSTRYSQYARNGKRKGVVAVRRLKALTDAGRKKFHDTYKTILGRNIYNDKSLRMYCYTPFYGKYYSDCSSSITLTFEKIGYKCGTYNEWGIYEKDTFENVPAKIVNGHITNPEVLKVGDVLLFAGDDPTKKLQIGHVEAVYEINGGTVYTYKDVVKNLQKFLNENYLDIVKHVTGLDKLALNGSYGVQTHRSTLAVWKYMANKYYGGNLLMDNSPVFTDECKKLAVKMADPAEIGKHPTLGFLAQGVLGAKEYYRGPFTGELDADTVAALKRFQKDRGLSQTGKIGERTWAELFD